MKFCLHFRHQFVYIFLIDIFHTTSQLPKRQAAAKKTVRFFEFHKVPWPMLILNILLGYFEGWAAGEKWKCYFISHLLSHTYMPFCSWKIYDFYPLKVIHTDKKLFCYVALICNLVQEFNGLVSKGSAAMLTLLLLCN